MFTTTDTQTLTHTEQTRLEALASATRPLHTTPPRVIDRVAYLYAGREQALLMLPAILDLGLAVVAEGSRQDFATPATERPVMLSVHLADGYYSDADDEIEPPPGWEERAVERARAEGVLES